MLGGRPRRRNRPEGGGVLAYRFQISTVPPVFGHRALEAAPEVHNWECVTSVPAKGTEQWVGEFRASMSVPPGDISVANKLSEVLAVKLNIPL